MRKFTKETLSNYNDKNGRPAYIAFNGTVYDVTNNVRKYWLNISTLFYLNTFSYLIFVY